MAAGVDKKWNYITVAKEFTEAYPAEDGTLYLACRGESLYATVKRMIKGSNNRTENFDIWDGSSAYINEEKAAVI